MGQYDECLEDEGGGGEQEVAARELGWVPQEEFKGDPEKWVAADEFMDRAEKLMPILRANNKRLSQSLLTRTREIDTLKTQLESATASIAKLERHYSDANRRAVENAKRELTESLKQAREENDVDAEVEIQDKLAELRATQGASDKKEEKPAPSTPNAEIDPEFQGWAEDNSDWFGPDKKKTKAFLRIAEDLREEGETATGRAFLDKCVALFEEQQTPSPRRTPSKVESGGNAPRGGGGKSWADLPKEAQQACLADVDTFVGEGKLYKTEADWKKHYVGIYFSE